MPAFMQDAIVGLGTDYRLRITIYEDEAQTQPRDLTGATAATWDLYTDRPHEPTQRSLIQKTLGAGIVIVAPATDGVLEVEVDPADQTGLTQRRYYHATTVTDATGNLLLPTVGFIDYQA